MTDPMPDQTENAQPPKRMTTAEAAALAQKADQNATAALRVAQESDDMVAAMSEKITDLQGRFAEVASTAGSPAVGDLVHEQLTADAVNVQIYDALAPLHEEVHALTRTVAEIPSRDQVDGRIHEALAPLQGELHEIRQRTPIASATGNLDSILARLEDAERKAASVEPGALTERVATELHGSLTELRRRLANVEAATQALDADPVSHTLAEDALADQIQASVERALTDLREMHTEDHRRVDQMWRQVEDLRQHVETHGTQVTRALVNEVAEQLAPVGRPSVEDYAASIGLRPAAGGLGAAKKVLEVMRMVTFIGKEKQADLGTGGKFKFRGIDDAMDAVGHAIREVGLIISPEILKDETTQNPITKSGIGNNGRPYENTVIWTTTKLTVRYTFLDPDDGSTHSIEMVGEGRDASDKSTSKAGSMAFKYGLLQGLCIPVTGLDDSDAAPPQHMEQERTQQRPPAGETARPAQQPAEERTSEQKAQRGRDALEAVRNVYRVPGGAQAQYSRVVQIMNHARTEGLLDLVLDGSTLDQHGRAALATLQAPPPAQEYQPSQAELDAAVRDLPSGQYPPDEGGY